MTKHNSHADTMTAWQTPAGQLPLDVAARETTLDGISQSNSTPIELDLSSDAAGQALTRALRVYHKAASRPRTAQCWAYVQCELWNARQDAVRAGFLVRGSQEHRFVSDRYTDATNRLDTARRMERAGRADARV